MGSAWPTRCEAARRRSLFLSPSLYIQLFFSPLQQPPNAAATSSYRLPEPRISHAFVPISTLLLSLAYSPILSISTCMCTHTRSLFPFLSRSLAEPRSLFCLLPFLRPFFTFLFPPPCARALSLPYFSLLSLSASRSSPKYCYFTK